MDDLISRSALLAVYDKVHQGPPGGARKLIEDAPDAIVRCKDCKHRPTPPKAWGAEINGKWCYWCELHRAWRHDDWFCANGEKG